MTRIEARRITGAATRRLSMALLALALALFAGGSHTAHASTFTVDDTGDAGDASAGNGTCATAGAVCTLRAAIQEANAFGGTDTIEFDIPGAGPHTIQPTSVLPAITDPVIIDGYTQTGASANTNPIGSGSNAVLKIELAGTLTGGDGLYIAAGPSTVKGLVINRWSDDGIQVQGDGGNTIQGNFIGTDVTGMADLGNSDSGVILDQSLANGNTIGGTTPEASNVISGNGDQGIMMESGPSGNVVQGNYVGTDATGTSGLPNGTRGIAMYNGSSDNTIGGTESNQGNVIAFNTDNGVCVSETASTGNTIRGNAIHSNGGLGIDLASTYGACATSSVTPNDGGDGDTGPNNLMNFPAITSLTFDGFDTTITGTLDTGTPETATIDVYATDLVDPSGYGEGRAYVGSETPDVLGDWTLVVTGSLPYALVTATATDASDNTSEFSETFPHVFIVHDTGDAGDANPGDASCDTAGAVCTLRAAIEEANATAGWDTIGFNIGGGGVQTISPGSALPTITDPVIIDGGTQPGHSGTPIIGLDGSGAGPDADGLSITAGDTVVRELVINSFGGDGIQVSTAGVNLLEYNYIGTDAAGTADLGNGGNGIHIVDVPTTTIANSTISGNDNNGVYITGAGATLTVIQGSFIGTDATGSSPLGNALNGVLIESPGNTVGLTWSPNVISGNGDNGIEISGSGAYGNLLQGNLIGTDASGTADLGNTQHGVRIDGAPGNTIGGDTAGERNIISGNDLNGVVIEYAGADENMVKGNYIGVDATGLTALPNFWPGVAITNGAQNNTVGGASVAEGNIISGNDASGVSIRHSGTTGNQVIGNCVGTDATGAADLGNAHSGVIIWEGASTNTIGGTAAGARNVISGNDSFGVWISDATTTGNAVLGNYIGTDATALTGIGNTLDGVLIESGASDNTIGGDTAGERNVISDNGSDGVQVIGASSTGNEIRGNSIFANGALGIELNNDGVTANDAGDSDTGPNDLMNFPVIASATYDGVKTTISGTLDTGTPETAVVDVYATDTADGSGYGEGRAYVGSAAPDAFGDWTLVVSGFPPYAHLTATATDASDNTSEFSLTHTPPVGGSLPLTKIVEEGDPAPAPVNGTFASLGPAWVPNTTDDVAFWASVTEGSTGEGIFQSSSGTITKLVAPGDPTGIGNIATLGQAPVMNEDGDVTFWAEVDGDIEGIFLYTESSGLVSKVAAVGDSTPSLDTFASFQDTNSRAMPVINNDGDIAFWGRASSGEGIFLYAGGEMIEIALTADSAPGTGGTFSTFVASGWPTVPIVTNNGQVSFWGEVTGGTASEGIFLSTGGVVDDVVVAGAATPAGGTYSFFGQAPSPNDSGEVAFWATVGGIGAPNCPGHGAPCAVFKVSDGTASEVVTSGDVGPLAVRGTVSDIGTVPLLNDSGQVTFRAGITGGLADEVLVRYTDGVMENVAAEGNTAPASTFTGFDPTGPAWAVPNNPGQVAFWADVDSGTEGIFLAGDATVGTEVEVAALAGANAPGCGATCQFGSNFDLDINSDGKAIFANTLTDGTATSGIFRFFAGSVEDVALQGQTAPDASGATFSTFGPPVNNDSDDVVARITLDDGKDALYRFFAGSPGANPEPALLALEDESAPGTNRFFAGFAEPAVNNLGYVVATVTTDDGAGGEVKDALYLFFAGSPGSDPVIVAEEDEETAQGTSRFFAGFAQPAINDMGQVVASVTTDDGAGGNVKEGLYRFFAGSPQDPEPLALEDNAAPQTSRFFAGFGLHPDVNILGNVAYHATLDDGAGGDVREALYLFFAGSSTTALLALQDDDAPSGAGGTYSGFGDPVVNDHDQVVAQATIDSGSASEGLFLFFAGTPTGEIALQGDTSESGGQYGGGPPVFPYVAYNNSADVVYVANIVSGPSPQGVFIASLDIEDDGVLDYLDNCPTIFNTDQKNTDKALAPVYSFVIADELGNACDDDIDGDGYANSVDGCSTDPTRWQTPIGDADCDGYTDADEGVIGTDPADNCPDNPTDDAWPCDFDMNGVINITDVFNVLPPVFGSSQVSGPPYTARADLAPDGVINITDVFKVLPPIFGQSCVP